MSDTDAAGPGTRTVVERATKPEPLKSTRGAPTLLVVMPTLKLPFASDTVATTLGPVIATLGAPASVNASEARPEVVAIGAGAGVGSAGVNGVSDPLHDVIASSNGDTASRRLRDNTREV